MADTTESKVEALERLVYHLSDRVERLERQIETEREITRRLAYGVTALEVGASDPESEIQ